MYFRWNHSGCICHSCDPACVESVATHLQRTQDITLNRRHRLHYDFPVFVNPFFECGNFFFKTKMSVTAIAKLAQRLNRSGVKFDSDDLRKFEQEIHAEHNGELMTPSDTWLFMFRHNYTFIKPRYWQILFYTETVANGDEWFYQLTKNYSNEELLRPKHLQRNGFNIYEISAFTMFFLYRTEITNWDSVCRYALEYRLDFGCRCLHKSSSFSQPQPTPQAKQLFTEVAKQSNERQHMSREALRDSFVADLLALILNYLEVYEVPAFFC